MFNIGDIIIRKNGRYSNPTFKIIEKRYSLTEVLYTIQNITLGHYIIEDISEDVLNNDFKLYKKKNG
jgi:hypothetical protein